VSTARQRSQRQAQRDQTRAQILHAAEEFLREHPFRELSLDVVMSQTGLTRTAFYRHFDDVTELVLQLLGDVGGELYAVAEEWVSGAEDDFAASTHEGLANIVDFFGRHGPLVQALVDAAAMDENVEQAYGAFLHAFDELIVQGLDGMVARGELPPQDTHALARALNLMNERYLLDMFGRRPFGDPATAVSTLEFVWMGAVGGGACPTR
jgi:AcrR family transcriptional regulator